MDALGVMGGLPVEIRVDCVVGWGSIVRWFAQLSGSCGLSRLMLMFGGTADEPAQVLGALMGSRLVASLEHLSLVSLGFLMDSMGTFAPLASAGLKGLDLSYNAILDEGLEDFARLGWEGLEVLGLAFVDMGSAGLFAMMDEAGLCSVHTLDLAGMSAGRRQLEQLMLGDGGLGGLQSLGLANLSMRGSVARVVSGCKLPLTVLDLSNNGIGDVGIRVLASSDVFEGLRAIDLRGNPITDVGADILLGSLGRRAGRECYLDLKVLSPEMQERVLDCWPENQWGFKRLNLSLEYGP